MNRLALLLSGLAATLCITAQAAPTEIPIWPNQTGPGSENLAVKQSVVERSKDPALKDRAVLGVSKPTLTVSPATKPSGVAVLITPGGAYARTVIDKEGADVAVPFNAAGITVFVLQYRLPAEGHFGSNGKDGKGRDVPLADAQRAIRTIRANAAQWGVNPAKIGILARRGERGLAKHQVLVHAELEWNGFAVRRILVHLPNPQCISDAAVTKQRRLGL